MTKSATSGWSSITVILRAGRAAIDELHRRLAERGHPHVRPAHGYAFQTIGTTGATVTELGRRLGVSKQAAGQMVDELTRLGYVVRVSDDHDGRRRLVTLTSLGHDCLEASAQILDELVDEWRRVAPGVDRAVATLEQLTSLYGAAELRPIW